MIEIYHFLVQHARYENDINSKSIFCSTPFCYGKICISHLNRVYACTNRLRDLFQDKTFFIRISSTYLSA